MVGDGAAGTHPAGSGARVSAVGGDAGQRRGAVSRAQALRAAAGVGVALVVRNALAYRLAVLYLEHVLVDKYAEST